MPPLYVVQQGAKIRIQNRRIQVEMDGDDPASPPEILLSQPIGHVSEVVLFGNIGLTTPAISALLAENIPVIFLTQEGVFRGTLTGEVTPHVPLRQSQYYCHSRFTFCLEMAKGFVEAKLRHQRALLQRHNPSPPLPAVEEAIDRIHGQIEAIPHKTNLNSLRGLEGASTAAYFSGYRSLFAPEWRFTDRNRQPPTDPVNVLLSFGYTLMAGTAKGAVQAVGLDPYAGFLHEVAYNRPSLALDLLEEFRPVVDGIVLWCCRSGQLTPQDFVLNDDPNRPILLLEEGKKRFLQAYENRMAETFTHPIRGMKYPLRQCIIEQARQIADRIRENRPGFTPMGFR